MQKHYIKIKLELERFSFQQQVEPHPEETLADLYDKSTIKKEKNSKFCLSSHTHTHTHSCASSVF